MTRITFWRKVVVRPFLWSRHDFICQRYPFEQVLQSNSFRLNMWNWLCCSSSDHVMISATDTSNALYKIHLQKNDAFTEAPTIEWHDCLSRISVIEMPKLYILTYIEVFGGVCVLSFGFRIFCWYRGFCHRTGSYLLLFLLLFVFCVWRGNVWFPLLVCEWDWLFNGTFNDISVIHVMAHTCAGDERISLT